MLKDLPQSAQDKIAHLLARDDFRGAKKIYDSLLEVEEKTRQIGFTKQTTYQSLVRVLSKFYSKNRANQAKKSS